MSIRRLPVPITVSIILMQCKIIYPLALNKFGISLKKISSTVRWKHTWVRENISLSYGTSLPEFRDSCQPTGTLYGYPPLPHSLFLYHLPRPIYFLAFYPHTVTRTCLRPHEKLIFFSVQHISVYGIIKKKKIENIKVKSPWPPW